MINEDELKQMETRFQDDYPPDADLRALIAEVRRLNVAYAVCKMMFDPDNQASPFRSIMTWRELVGAFEPEALAEWAKHNRIS